MTGCRVAQRDFCGWQAAYLENDLIRLVAVPDIGGRIMAYDLGPYAYLYVAPGLAGKHFSPEEHLGDGSLAAWKNYGGDKTWPAPQGWENDRQWHGPPDPILDGGRYRLDALQTGGAAATIRMTSPAHSPTGVRITRQARIYVGSARVTLDLSFHNVTVDQPVRWSIWDVVQLNAGRHDGDRQVYEPGCIVTAPLNPESAFARGFQVMFGDENNPQWRADLAARLFFGEYRWEIGKVGLDSRGGWAAFSNSAAGHAFVARFTPYPDQEYPDGGSDVEFWTVGRGRVANLDYEGTDICLMECEVLSPLQTIAPGAKASFQVEWGACRCPGPVVAVTDGGCASRALHLARAGEYAHLTGALGVFDQGELELAWHDAAGQTLETMSLGPVSPLGAVLLDQVYRLPVGATAAELVVAAGEPPRTLARAALD